LPFRNLKETILILITLGAVVYFNVTTIFMVNFFTLNIGVGLITFLLSIFYNAVFDRYVPKPQVSDTWEVADMPKDEEKECGITTTNR